MKRFVKISRLPLIVITGPTASGKTALAINLAKKLDAEIISADSRCVYKGLDIVSAKPAPDEMQGVPHHLIDIMEPLDEPYSAGDFVSDAKKCIDKIQSKGKPVIISGGTWFYIKCLLDKEELPEISSDKSYRTHLETFDNNTLWKMLENIDKKRADEIHPNNKERVIRALEMAHISGGKVSKIERKLNTEYDALWFANDFTNNENRQMLYDRINLRVDKMVEKGLYFEWEKMCAKYNRTKVLENTIGYKEFFELEDKVYSSIDEAIEKIKQRTRNFAKRQLTYFKSELRIKNIKNEDEILTILKNLGNF